MKALKIASLTALAAAISAQAAAEFYITKGADITVSGALTTEAVLNLGEATEAYLIDNKGTNLKLSVTNNTWSGSVNADLGGSFELAGVTVTDGNITFGQIGNSVNTAKYTAKQDDLAYGTDAGIKLDLGNGISAQLDGTVWADAAAEKAAVADNPWTLADEAADPEDAAGVTAPTLGLGVAATQSVADGITVHASAQARFVGDLESAKQAMEFGDHYAGAGVTAAVAGATIKAGFQSKGETYDYGVSANYSVAGVTVDVAAGQAKDADLVYMASAAYAYSADGVAASAKATYDSAEDWDAKVEVDASLTQDALKYFAGADVTIQAETATDVEAGVTYTRAASYTAKVVSGNFENNKVVVTASYSF